MLHKQTDDITYRRYLRRIRTLMSVHSMSRRNAPYEVHRKVMSVYATLSLLETSTDVNWFKALEDQWTTWRADELVHKYPYEDGMQRYGTQHNQSENCLNLPLSFAGDSLH